MSEVVNLKLEPVPALINITKAVDHFTYLLRQCKKPDDEDQLRGDHKFADGVIPFYIAGGAITSAVTGQNINDYDIFSPRPQDLIDRLKENGYKESYSTEQFTNFIIDNKKYQVITRYAVDHPEELYSLFDFSIVCVRLWPMIYNFMPTNDFGRISQHVVLSFSTTHSLCGRWNG